MQRYVVLRDLQRSAVGNPFENMRSGLGTRALAPPEPKIEVEDLEATLASVEAAGGEVVQPIFAFPGGRRFHFRDPDGHVLAAMVAE